MSNRAHPYLTPALRGRAWRLEPCARGSGTHPLALGLCLDHDRTLHRPFQILTDKRLVRVQPNPVIGGILGNTVR